MTNITIPKNFTGELVAVPKREYHLFNSFLSFIDAEQVFFWTKEWQAKEKEADRDIKNGRVSKVYDSAKNFRKALSLLKK